MSGSWSSNKKYQRIPEESEAVDQREQPRIQLNTSVRSSRAWSNFQLNKSSMNTLLSGRSHDIVLVDIHGPVRSLFLCIFSLHIRNWMHYLQSRKLICQIKCSRCWLARSCVKLTIIVQVDDKYLLNNAKLKVWNIFWTQKLFEKKKRTPDKI